MGEAVLVPWHGDATNLIDRFDARISLDELDDPARLKADPTLAPEDEISWFAPRIL